ncbi:unnamed protein product [Macrosiphum euphorbiae]|uniref:Envelope protein n=2 Tax=Macrosiphum euphorbiae TaxID=13131 RepID=A0AAV0WCN1_9HEMI|nr:unnamed protein product [Macrosiphum euphorbiae]
MMILKLFVTTALMTSVTTEEDMDITVSSGAFFEEVQEAIMYDKSIPLIYTQEIGNNGEEIMDNGWNIEKYCSGKNTNYCKITKQIITLLKTINKNTEENALDMSDMLIRMFNNKRSKRGIQFIGNLYHFCCNVATEKQLKNLYTNEDMINQQIKKFKDAFVSDHQDLVNITSELNKYTKTNNNNLDILKTSFREFIKEEIGNDMLEKTNHENTIQGMQEIIFSLLTTMLKFTNYEKDSSNHLHCKLQKIPTRLIRPNILEKDLINLSEILQKDGYELVIPTEDLSAYYSLPITECQFSKNQILIKIKIPIQEHMAKWKLYQYIPTHFKFEDAICIIFSEKTYIAINSNNNEHRIISGVGLQHCDPPVTDLCYIPKFSSDITLSPKCVESIFKNKPLEIINEYCYFQCVKQHRDDTIIIKQIGINTYALTNPQPTLIIKKINRKNKDVTTEELKINYKNPGLIKIHLPCNYELIQNSKTIIPKMYPCESNNINKLKLKRVLPISWTNIKSLKINNEEPKGDMYFGNITEILNKNWKTDIPNFQVSKQIKNPEKYFNDLILKKIPQPLIDDFLADIIYLTWLTILTLLTGFICYKIYPIFIKINMLTISPPIPQRQ